MREGDEEEWRVRGGDWSQRSLSKAGSLHPPPLKKRFRPLNLDNTIVMGREITNEGGGIIWPRWRPAGVCTWERN